MKQDKLGENLPEDIRKAKLVEWSMVHNRQCVAGDNLNISVWQDEESVNNREIKVQIEQSENNICDASFSFAKDKIVSHL